MTARFRIVQAVVCAAAAVIAAATVAASTPAWDPEDPELYPVGFDRPTGGRRALVAVYDSTVGNPPLTNRPEPPALPPVNGVLDGIRLTLPSCSNGQVSLVQVRTAFSKSVSDPISFYIVLRIFDTIDDAAADPAIVNRSQIGPTMAFGPITQSGPIGDYLTPALSLPPGGIITTDATVGIDLKFVSTAADPANPASLIDPANLIDGVSGNVFVTGTAATTYPAGSGVWVDADSPGGSPPTSRDGDYTAAEAWGTGQAAASLYLRVFADIPTEGCPPDTCDSAAPISPPPPGGSINGWAVVTGATVSSPPYCAGQAPAERGAWFRVPGGGRRLTASTCQSTGTPDTVIKVLTGSCGSLECVNGNDDVGDAGGCPNARASSVTFCAELDRTYYIFVREGQSGPGVFLLTLSDTNQPCRSVCSLVPSACLVPESDCAAADTNGTCVTAVNIDSGACATGITGMVNSTGAAADTDMYWMTVPADHPALDVTVSTLVPLTVSFTEFSPPPDPCDQNAPRTLRAAMALDGCETRRLSLTALAPGHPMYIVVRPPSLTTGTACQAGAYSIRIAPRPAGCPNDCFNRAATAVGGRFGAGGPNCVADSEECMGDWDRNGFLDPSDVAAYIEAWFFAVQHPASGDADIDCDGAAMPADVAGFVANWFVAIANPAGAGC